MRQSTWDTIKKDVIRFYYQGTKHDVQNEELPHKVIFHHLLSFIRKDFQSFRTLFYYRLDEYFKTGGKNSTLRMLIRKLLINILKKKYPPSKSFYIWVGEIEPGGCYFYHPFSTVLCCNHIGNGCVFRNNTTIGTKIKDGILVRPYLGDYVDVGVNAVIIGDIKIGNNVSIGAGSVVTKDVPDNCVVVGNPARIIYKNGERVNIEL